jgi:hypothetical protein
MKSLFLPSVSVDTVAAAETICANISAIGENVTCRGIDFIFQCLAIPSNWDLYDGGVYFPYAWADVSIIDVMLLTLKICVI